MFIILIGDILKKFIILLVITFLIGVVPSLFIDMDVKDEAPIYSYTINNEGNIKYTDILKYYGQVVDSLELNLYENNVISIDYIKNGVSINKELHLYEIVNNMIVLSIDQYDYVSLPFIVNGDTLSLIEHSDDDPDFIVYYNRYDYYVYFLDNNICEVDLKEGKNDDIKYYFFYEYDSSVDKYYIYTKLTIFTRGDHGELSYPWSQLEKNNVKLIWR